MIGELTNHVWQSTLFAVAAGLLTAAFRKNRAQIRYWLWLSASFKFFIPFSLLMSLGSHLQWVPAVKKIATPDVSLTMDQITRPFPDASSFVPSTSGTIDWAPIAFLGVWVCGFGVIALTRLQGWLRIRAAVRSSAPLKLSAAVEVRSSPGLLEPGVVGLWRPILLLPAGIVERLTPRQLEAVLAHELCHIRRRDNLSAAIHMIVEALFWFHPLVWWIGARLVEERERACDEDVLRLGSEPQIYAEAILNVCKYYLESPLVCVSGITGSDLKKRIDTIMAHHIAQNLNLTRKLLLAVGGFAAVVAPIAIGLLNAPAGHAQSQEAFDVASVKLNKTGGRGGYPGLAPGGQRFTATNLPLLALIMLAYNVTPRQISGVPSSFNTEGYDIDAKCDHPIEREQALRMLQTLLADRFKLTLHRETRDQPIYALVVGKGGPKLHETAEESLTPDAQRTGRRFVYKSTPVSVLTLILSQQLDRTVVDMTGLKGRYDFSLEYTSDRVGRGVLEGREPAPDPDGLPSISTAVQEQLGLKLESRKGPVEFIVVDHAERPSGN
jgi:bla regulator protein blaR1